MNAPLNSALLADGTSDRALIHIILWTLRDLRPGGEFSRIEFFPRRHDVLFQRVDDILKDYGPDILFVHRDAENQSIEDRILEIPVKDRLVPIIPVRMTEAWLLINENAIRHAASNPNGDVSLKLPSLKSLEKSQAKSVLRELLMTASGNTGRRLKKFNVDRAVHRVAELIDDFSPLKKLSAYAAFRQRLDESLTHLKI
jgi:hypothetical protein